MDKFLSCDWGTTSFRLRLIEKASAGILAEEQSDKGIAETFAAWKQEGASAETRISFYLFIIDEHIKLIEKRLGVSLDNIPVVISGMASAGIGLIELPYKMLPVKADGSDIKTHTIESPKGFAHAVTIISGVRTENDVIRGEETQLIGALHTDLPAGENIFIFPGTHSKHIVVENSSIIRFTTYMTGEFFDLLSKKSILSLSVMRGGSIEDIQNKQSFEQGVKDGSVSNLLHHSFLVRTNDLFQKCSKEENYYYLSGLLLGTELNTLQNDSYSSVILVSDTNFYPYYISALNTLGIKNIQYHSSVDAIIKGQIQIMRNLNK